MALQKNNKIKLGIASVGFLLLFSLPFAGFGIFMTSKLVKYFSDAAAVQSWIEVPARLDELELEKLRSSSGKRKRTTYRVKAGYTYEYLGKAYKGSRVSLSDEADNIGSFQQDTYRTLKRYLGASRALPAYINPAAPQDSILVRKLRWGLVSVMSVLGNAFLLIGFGLIFFAFISFREALKKRAFAQKYPNSPWMHCPAWNINRIPAGSLNGIIFLWVAVVLAAFSTLTPAIPAFEGVANGKWAMVFLFLLPALGIAIIYFAIIRTLRWKRFGQSVLEMKTVPGRIGGEVAGAVLITQEIPNASVATCSIICTEFSVEYSGGKRHHKTRTLFESETQVRPSPHMARGFRQALHFNFEIPPELPESSDSSPKINWEIKMVSILDGADMNLSFEIPVFR